MDMHIVRGSESRLFVRVIAHMDVTGNNTVNVPFATAIVLSGYSSGKSVLPSGDGSGGTISAAESAQLADGTRHEFTFECPLPETWDSLTGGQKQTHVRGVYNAKVAEIQAEILRELNYFGFTFN